MSSIKTGFCVICVMAVVTAGVHAQETAVETVSKAEVKRLVERYFEKQEHRSGDIIDQGDVKKLLTYFKAMGWEVSNGKELVELTLPENDYLVEQLNTRPGKRFMHKVSRYPGVYSRLDRLIREPGGRVLVRDLIRLPDGHRYAQAKPPRGVPEMSEFLPKRGNSRQRKVKDYRKPTGRIYTDKDLLKKFEESHKKDLGTVAKTS